ncbi:recombinase RecT [Paenibacillus bouchesdurhonensis]|uniref:recombinase RecT n=1 Tax=Paenibacillus bouchesdurhonensis TaxID=1870990 RepID=UPI000DA63059|nr:recombinase RecT [Paenibacillus bouchesdurhonensis]
MAKDTQVQAVDINQIQQIGDFGVAELMAMKESIAKKLTIPQFNLFMYQMNRMGLDPSLGHGVPILYGQDVNIRIEYEGFHSLARKSPGYVGVYRQVVCENEVEDFEAETNEDGVVTKIRHKIRFPRGKVVGAYAIAKREGREDVIVLCDKTEFEKYAKKNPSFWKLEDGSLDPDMCKKHAATRAVKEQFDIALAVEENMTALNAGIGDDSTEPVRRDITAEANAAASTTPPPAEEPKQTPPPKDDAADLKKCRAEMKRNFAKLGIDTPEAIDEYIKNHGKIKGDKPTLAEFKALLKVMELHIAEKQQAEQDELPI